MPYLLVFLLVLLALVGIGYYFVSRVLPYTIIQPGNWVLDATPGQYGLPYEHFKLAVRGGAELDTFFVPAVGAARANLIVLHGVGSCKEKYLQYVAELVRDGYNVLLWDQRAHGKSGGKFCTYGFLEKHDVATGLAWLNEKFPQLPTGIYGNSMGGAVAIQALAMLPELRFGLIESTFTDLPAVTQAYGRRLSGLPIPRWLTDLVLTSSARIADFPAFAIRPIDEAPRVTQPVLHIHGDADASIGIAHAHALYAAYGSEDKALFVVPDGDHADLWDKGGDGYREVWFGFFRREW